MNLDELKNTWQEVNMRLDRLEKDNRRMAAELATGRATSDKQRLAETFRRTAFTGFVLPLLAIALPSILDMPLWIAWVYAAFGVLMGILNYNTYRCLHNTDFAATPVVDAIEAMLKIRLRRQRILLFGIITGIMVIVSMFVDLLSHSTSSTIAAFFIGLVIGAVFGIIKYRRQTALIRKLLAELHAARAASE